MSDRVPKALTDLASQILLPRYDDMCRAIAACHRIDEAKEIRDKAEALRAYTRQIRNRDAEVQFAEIKVRAERRCGELLDMLKRSGGRRVSGDSRTAGAPTISDFGMSQVGAQRARMTAAVPRKAFEEHLAEHRDRMEPVSSRSVRMIGKPHERRADAILRGANAIEAMSELPLTPAQFVKALSSETRARVAIAAATAASWLDQVARELQEVA